jgi:lysophospholipase L1-like esterase
MIIFGKHSGKIMYIGDSITVGHNALSGGWRKNLNVLMTAENREFSCVGLFSDPAGMAKNNHLGISGDKATTQTISVVQSRITTYQPNIIILGYGMNDLGQGVTPAAFITSIKNIVDWINAVKFCKIYIQKIIVPTMGHPYASFASNFNTANTLIEDLPNYSSNISIVNINGIATSDGIHPIDGATGYDKMGTQIHDALEI